MEDNLLSNNVDKSKKTEICEQDCKMMQDNALKKIEELTCELKEKEFEIQSHVEKWQFYEQIIRNLTTFKR